MEDHGKSEALCGRKKALQFSTPGFGNPEWRIAEEDDERLRA
jgi:hypothetical protein